MYDDETEVFNLANRCLETSTSDQGTSQLLAGRFGGSKDLGDDSWTKELRYLRLQFQSKTLIWSPIWTNRINAWLDRKGKVICLNQ